MTRVRLSLQSCSMRPFRWNTRVSMHWEDAQRLIEGVENKDAGDQRHRGTSSTKNCILPSLSSHCHRLNIRAQRDSEEKTQTWKIELFVQHRIRTVSFISNEKKGLWGNWAKLLQMLNQHLIPIYLKVDRLDSPFLELFGVVDFKLREILITYAREGKRD